MRFMTAVMSSGRGMTSEHELLRRCVAQSLALAEEVTVTMLAEPAAPLDAIEVPADLDSKVVRALARGTWDACLRDGADPVTDALANSLCARLGCDRDVTDEVRREAKARLEASGASGIAAVESIRYVLSDDLESSRESAAAAGRLMVAPVYRAPVMLGVEQGDQVVLARRHALERDAREAVLSLAWLAAWGTDPNVSRAAELEVRHDRVAADLSDQGEGRAARELVQRLVQEQLQSAVQAAGM